jgi:hypothetical protein
MTSRSRRVLLALYPPRWRQRYSDEVLGFLDDEFSEERLPVGVVVEVASSAVVERSRRCFEVPVDTGAPDGTRGLRLLTWGWCSCVIGGIGFAKATEHFSSARFVIRGVPAGATLAMGSFAIVEVLAAVAAVLVAAVAVPAILVAWAQGPPETRRRLAIETVLAAAVTMATVAWLGVLIVWARGLTSVQRDGADARYGLAVVGLAVVGALSLAAWTSVANRALREVRPPQGGMPVRWIARAAAACMAVVAGGAGLWWVAVGIDAPGFFAGRGAVAMTTEWPMVGLALCLLVVGAVLAVAGSWVCAPLHRGDAVAV